MSVEREQARAPDRSDPRREPDQLPPRCRRSLRSQAASPESAQIIRAPECSRMNFASVALSMKLIGTRTAPSRAQPQSAARQRRANCGPSRRRGRRSRHRARPGLRHAGRDVVELFVGPFGTAAADGELVREALPGAAQQVAQASGVRSRCSWCSLRSVHQSSLTIAMTSSCSSMPPCRSYISVWRAGRSCGSGKHLQPFGVDVFARAAVLEVNGHAYDVIAGGAAAGEQGAHVFESEPRLRCRVCTQLAR